MEMMMMIMMIVKQELQDFQTKYWKSIWTRDRSKEIH